MMRFLLSFFLKHLDKIVIVLLVAALVGFIYVTGRKHERNVWKPKYDLLQTTIATERKSHEDAMEANRVAAEQRFVAATDLREQARQHLEDRLHFHSARADSLANRLRNAEASRVRPLAPAASAPADCRDYEADPTRLSGEARGFLIGEAAAAEETGELLLACRKDYQVVRAACGVKP
jgi:hypothetical protein